MNAFCPACQAEWSQPWYDVCPACGHRFKPRPSAMPAMIAMALGPAVCLTGAYLGETGSGGLGGNLLIGGAILVVVGSIVAAALLARRTTYTTGGKVALALFLAPVVLAIVGAITFGACALVANRV